MTDPSRVTSRPGACAIVVSILPVEEALEVQLEVSQAIGVPFGVWPLGFRTRDRTRDKRLNGEIDRRPEEVGLRIHRAVMTPNRERDSHTGRRPNFHPGRLKVGCTD